MASIIERLGSNGQVTYYVRIRRRGFAPASASFTRKTDVNRWIAETEQAIRDGRYLEQVEGRKHTLSEAIDRYLSEFEYNLMRKNQLKQWEEELGHKFISDIHPGMISDIILKWKKEPNKRGEIRKGAILNRYLSTLSVLFTAAVRDWQWHTKNPVKDVRRQKEPKGRVRFLSAEERELLLAECKKSYCPYLYLIVVLALSTGMRKAEIGKLRWRDVNLEHGIIILEKTKNGERRRVAVRGRALELLKQHSIVRQLNTDFLFPGELTHLNSRPFDFRKAWIRAKKNTGIENFVFHDLRHSCASYLAMGGASILEIAEVLGHKTLDMVKRYSHLTESHTASVVEKMNQKIFVKLLLGLFTMK
jgi:integrase